MRESLRFGHAMEIWIATGRERSLLLDEVRREAGIQKVPVREVEPQEIERIAPGQNAQGVLARIRPIQLLALAELLDRVQESSDPAFLLVLDQIQDPHNVGALIRTANAAGAHGVLLPERHSAGLSAAVARTSAGAVYSLPAAQVTNLSRALEELKRAGIWIVGLDAAAQQVSFDADLTVPLALVVGGEGTGMRQLTRRACDLVIKLPMHGAVASLNASVAGGIAMYEILRQRSTQ